MNKDKFNKSIKSMLESKSFINYKKIYYKEVNDVYFVLELQKSFYSNSYYLNYRMFVKEIHSKEDIFKLTIGDLSGRVLCKENGQNIDLIELDNWNDDYFIVIEKEIDSLIGILESGGIRNYLNLNPTAIHKVPSWASAYFKEIIKEKI